MIRRPPRSPPGLTLFPYTTRFRSVDENIIKDDLFSIALCEHRGSFIRINRDIKEVTIGNKLKLRRYTNNILVKGFRRMPYHLLRWLFEEIPVYFNEIVVVKEPNDIDYELLFVSDGDLKYLFDYKYI